MKYCESCNDLYPDSAQFCPACGKKLVHRPEKVNRRKVLSILNSLPGYKKILQDCTLYNYDDKVHFDYIVIHEAGIFVFQFFEEYRILEGNDKMRYWTAENINKNGEIGKIERPVVSLEKDHSILDQLLRRYTFTKSFAFLIFPQDGGLEKVNSVHLDQMLTLPRMGGILIRAINDYGHAYDKADIDKLYDILSKLIKKQPIPHQEQIAKSHKVKTHSKIRRFLAILFLLAALVAAVAFIITKQDQPVFLPAGMRQEPSSTVTATPPQSSDRLYVIPSAYRSLFDQYAQSELNRAAAEIDCSGFQRQDDGSIVISSVRTVDHILSSASSAFQNSVGQLFDSRALSDFTSIRTENHTQFTVFVTSQEINSTEALVVEEMYRLGLLYAALENRSPDTFSIVFRGQEGQELSVTTLYDYISRWQK